MISLLHARSSWLSTETCIENLCLPVENFSFPISLSCENLFCGRLKTVSNDVQAKSGETDIEKILNIPEEIFIIIAYNEKTLTN